MTQQTSSLEYLAGRYSCELAFAHQHPQLCLEFIQKLLSDPAILDHIPAVKALREENEQLRSNFDLVSASCERRRDRIADLEATNAAQAEQLAKLDATLREIHRAADSQKVWAGQEYKYPYLAKKIVDLCALIQPSTPAEPQAGVELTDEEIDRIAVDMAILSGIIPDELAKRVGCFNGERYARTVYHNELRLFARAIERALNQRQAVKAEPLSAAQGMPEETYVLFGYATGKFLERIVPPAQGKLINNAVALYAKADFSQMNAAAQEESKEEIAEIVDAHTGIVLADEKEAAR